MLDSDGSIKVIDFGATKKLNNRTAQVYYGKFGYAPLEQSLGEGQGPWTDVYGICATMYCMITGEIPVDAFRRSMNEPLVPITDYGIPMDQRIAVAIMKGMNMATADRQQYMGQLRRSLYGLNAEEISKKNEPVYFPTINTQMLYDKKNRLFCHKITSFHDL